MKKLKITIVALFLAGSTAWAQASFEKGDKHCKYKEVSSKNHHKKCDNKKLGFEAKMQELNLTDEQKKSFKEINTEMHRKMKISKEKYAPIISAMKSEINKAKENSDNGKMLENRKSEIQGKYHEQLEPMRNEMRVARESFKNSLASVLSEEQNLKLKDCYSKSHKNHDFVKPKKSN